MMYKIITTLTPNYLFKLFPKVDDEIRRSERLQSSAFAIPTATTSTYRYTFSVQAMNLWNEIPYTIRLKKYCIRFQRNIV